MKNKLITILFLLPLACAGVSKQKVSQNTTANTDAIGTAITTMKGDAAGTDFSGDYKTSILDSTAVCADKNQKQNALKKLTKGSVFDTKVDHKDGEISISGIAGDLSGKIDQDGTFRVYASDKDNKVATWASGIVGKFSEDKKTFSGDVQAYYQVENQTDPNNKCLIAAKFQSSKVE